MQSHLQTCPTFFCLGKRVKRAQLLCTVILVSSSSTLPLFNCILRILLIASFSSSCCLAISTPTRSPRTLPVSIPRLPPGAYLSGLVPVCLFADDSTWSRCDAQQLFLCSAVPSLPHTPPLLPLISPHSHLSVSPSSVSYVPIYLRVFLFRRCSSVNWRV